MSTETVEKPRTDHSGIDTNELVHWQSCCYPQLALCGLDLTGQQLAADDDSVDCVVCLDLAYTGLTCRQILRPRK